MSILTKAKQFNNNYFQLPYALMEKTRNSSKKVKALFKHTSDEVQNETKSAFTPKNKPRLNYSSRVLLGLFHTEEKVFGHTAELSYRKITDKIGHSSKTTAANLKQLKDVLENSSKSTYHINVEYDGTPFVLCYEFLFNEELQLEEGQKLFKLCDLEAILVSLIVNNKLNPKTSKDFNGTVNCIASALNIPPSTACSLINRLIDKGVLKYFREYVDENGNTVIEAKAKAKNKNEKTLLTAHSRIIRRCNVIYKEYKKRAYEKKQEAAEPDKPKKQDKRTTEQQAPKKELTDEEKFDVIEAKFIRDKKYLSLTEKYKELKSRSLAEFRKDKDEEKFDALENSAKNIFSELCYYLYGNGVSREQLPTTFARLIRNIEA